MTINFVAVSNKRVARIYFTTDSKQYYAEIVFSCSLMPSISDCNTSVRLLFQYLQDDIS